MALPPDPGNLLARLAGEGIRFGLERPRRLFAALGEPQRRFPAVLVAGTNGKGSTAALLTAMSEAAGYCTGLYTSPHLESPEEEIRLGGEPISRRRLGELLARACAAAEEVLGGPPTAFEAMTAAAFLHFAEGGAELAVLEAGMGGARDATNLAEPAVSLVTTVSLEHQRWLGAGVEEIAREKAGVFRSSRPALAGAGPTADSFPVRRVLEEEAARRGAVFHWLPDEVSLEALSLPAGRVLPEGSGAAQRVTLRTPRRSYRLEIALAGEHQAWNLALAVRAAEELAAAGWERLDAAAIRTGAAACRWPGRLETVELPGGRRLLLDTAHNPAAAAALADHLAARGEPYDLLFGVLTDKDAAAMLALLGGEAGQITLTRPAGPRGRPPAELTALLPPGVEARVEPDLAAALDRALAEPEPLLVVAGSLALVGWVRRHLRADLPPPGDEITGLRRGAG